MGKNNIIYLFCFFIILFIANSAIASTTITPQMICFQNLSILQSVINKYNKEHINKIENLDAHSMNLLIEDKYLDKEPFTTHYRCRYLGKGLDKDGVVYCEFHGSLDGSKLPSPEYFIEEKEKENKERSVYLWAVLIIAVILFGIFNPRFFKNNKSEQ